MARRAFIAVLFVFVTLCLGWVWRMMAEFDVVPLPLRIVGMYATLYLLAWWLRDRLASDS